MGLDGRDADREVSVYWLYLESGPKHRKTMVHVLDLLGCVAVGPTTEAALDATPSAIRAFPGFLRRHGREADPDVRFATRVAEHVTEGEWLGNGSPYLVFAPDLQPPTDEEIERHLERFRWLAEDPAAWARTRTDAELDEPPGGPGRTARAILLHTLGSTGPYLAAALGDAPDSPARPRPPNAARWGYPRRSCSPPTSRRTGCARRPSRLGTASGSRLQAHGHCARRFARCSSTCGSISPSCPGDRGVHLSSGSGRCCPAVWRGPPA